MSQNNVGIDGILICSQVRAPQPFVPVGTAISRLVQILSTQRTFYLITNIGAEASSLAAKFSRAETGYRKNRLQEKSNAASSALHSQC